MSAVFEVIRECELQGIRLSQNGDKLHVVPASKLTPELKAVLLQHKLDILAALADEDAREYRDERAAICASDSLPPCGIRPVFVYQLKDYPAEYPILLGAVGETIKEAELLLRDRFGDRLLSVAVYTWPPVPPCVH